MGVAVLPVAFTAKERPTSRYHGVIHMPISPCRVCSHCENYEIACLTTTVSRELELLASATRPEVVEALKW